MRKLICAFLLTLTPVLVSAAGAAHLDKANIDPTNRESLQKGAKYFVNYCLSCHSASYMRYNRMARDLGLSEIDVEKNMMFATEKAGNTMDVNMTDEDARNWFGTRVPDLTVIARSRSIDWLYTYLRSFYADNSRPFGANNTAFPDVAMPHVLWELQGMQKLTNREAVHSESAAPEFKITSQGSMTPREYDKAVRDLVNFLDYMGEPAKQKRQALGIYVLLFLFLFLIVAYAMKKEYWKDIH